MSKYDAVAQRALATITRKGGVVTFPGTASGGIYDPLADSFSGAGSEDKTGKAVQIEGDPDRFAALNLVLTNPVTLMIAAHGLALTPVPGMAFTWAGVTYSTKDADAVAPDGTPIIYVIIGSA